MVENLEHSYFEVIAVVKTDLSIVKTELQNLKDRTNEDRKEQKNNYDGLFLEIRGLKDTITDGLEAMRKKLFGNGSGEGEIPKILKRINESESRAEKRMSNSESRIRTLEQITERRRTPEEEREGSIWARSPISREKAYDFVILVIIGRLLGIPAVEWAWKLFHGG